MSTGSAQATDIRRDGTPPPAADIDDPPGGAPAALFTLADVLAVLDVGGDVPPVPARCLSSAHGGILGSQLLGQQIVLAERMTPGKQVHTLQTIFMRPGDCDQPIWIDVERLAHGRSVDSMALTSRQGSLQICRADVMLRSPEPDFVDLHGGPPDVPGPEHAQPTAHPYLPWETRALARERPHDLDQWQRLPGAPADPSFWRALIAHTCEILPLSHLRAALGLDPPAGLTVVPAGVAPANAGASLAAPPSAATPPTTTSSAGSSAGLSATAGRQVRGAVLAQTVTFFDELDVRDWHLVQIRTKHLGYGRATFRVEMYGPGGELRASSECISLLRATTA